jgi:hypothetical protein
MIVAVVALSSRGKLDELRMTVNAAILSGFATVLLSGVLPGSGNLSIQAHTSTCGPRWRGRRGS